MCFRPCIPLRKADYKNNMRSLQLTVFLLPLLITGCAGIGYAPSNTNWRSIPKIVVQVCSPNLHNGKAEVVLYRSFGQNLGLGSSIEAKIKTVAGQDVFEDMLDDESPMHEAIGVRILSDEPQNFYIFRMQHRYSKEWTDWIAPTGEEDQPPSQIDKFKYERTRKLPAPSSLQNIPRLRARLEMIADYEKRTRRGLIFEQIPACQ